MDSLTPDLVNAKVHPEEPVTFGPIRYTGTGPPGPPVL